MSGDIPQWAKERAMELSCLFNSPACLAQNKEMAWGKAVNAFARYIAEHEEPPVDPLLIEARKLVAARSTRPQEDRYIDYVLKGYEDNSPAVQNTIIALKRGIELAGGQSNG